ncbi:hypothetical protein C8R44DRAFT_868452 [Mycena epipterygia]|nr:hypothetical protein C8R44DRAFT_868452 [Mycena epipterygia]
MGRTLPVLRRIARVLPLAISQTRRNPSRVHINSRADVGAYTHPPLPSLSRVPRRPRVYISPRAEMQPWLYPSSTFRYKSQPASRSVYRRVTSSFLSSPSSRFLLPTPSLPPSPRIPTPLPTAIHTRHGRASFLPTPLHLPPERVKSDMAVRLSFFRIAESQLSRIPPTCESISRPNRTFNRPYLVGRIDRLVVSNPGRLQCHRIPRPVHPPTPPTPLAHYVE